MHLLLVVLLASLVHLSSSAHGPNEVFMPLKDGFPDGSLLTVYLNKFTDMTVWPDTSVYIKLCGKYSVGGNCFYFDIDVRPDGVHVGSGNIRDESGSMVNSEAHDPALPARANIAWWRFDLYKISDKQFLPFFQGFEANVRTKLDSTGLTFTEVGIRPNFKGVKLNFDKDDVYVTIKYPATNKCTPLDCKPGMVIQALNKENYDNSIKDGVPRTHFLTLPKGSFLEGTKIRLSALLVSHTGDYWSNWASIYFFNPKGTWSFGFQNRWSRDGKSVEFELFSGRPCTKEDEIELGGKCDLNWKTHGTNVRCLGDATTSSDIVHVKLERLKGTQSNVIKLRTYYSDGKAGGITCQKDVVSWETKKKIQGPAGFLDNALKVEGDHMARLLHFEMV